MDDLDKVFRQTERGITSGFKIDSSMNMDIDTFSNMQTSNKQNLTQRNMEWSK